MEKGKIIKRKDPFIKNNSKKRNGTGLKKWIPAVLAVVLFTGVLPCGAVQAEETNLDLYARGAVLMDADSGRVLYGKEEDVALPMASTTKIMTCILALEHGNQEDEVGISSYAASQPQVHLGAAKGESFYLKDLLYSLMLESHNDAAVAIAEHIGGSVEGFAEMMNDKAKEIGCSDTHFITPNGLDAVEVTDGREQRHSTTAKDLALIMRYCIMTSPQKEAFLEITRTPAYGFANRQGSRSYNCVNHNAFLTMMDGALSGKTGFTGGAGYCYVGALRRGERTFIVALLACGWPNHKTYKWVDTRKLMEYGLQNYEYRNIYKEVELKSVRVLEGVPDTKECDPYAEVKVEVELREKETGGTEKTVGTELNFLVSAEDEVRIDVAYAGEIQAPVKAGRVVGKVVYNVNDEPIKEYDVVLKKDIAGKDWKYMGKYILQEYLMGA